LRGLFAFKVGAVFVSDNGVWTNKRAFEQPILCIYDLVCLRKKCFYTPDHTMRTHK
jgi:hypothetical protein